MVEAVRNVYEETEQNFEETEVVMEGKGRSSKKNGPSTTDKLLTLELSGDLRTSVELNAPADSPSLQNKTVLRPVEEVKQTVEVPVEESVKMI